MGHLGTGLIALDLSYSYGSHVSAHGTRRWKAFEPHDSKHSLWHSRLIARELAYAFWSALIGLEYFRPNFARMSVDTTRPSLANSRHLAPLDQD